MCCPPAYDVFGLDVAVEYHHFLISNANGAFVFYDEENETKLNYLVAQLNRADNFPVQMLRFDALQDIADEMADEMNQ